VDASADRICVGRPRSLTAAAW